MHIQKCWLFRGVGRRKAPIIDKQIILPDGRKLGFAEYGNKAGRPVFYFHGFPGSRLEASLLDEVAANANIRVIGVDRPGYGNSDRLPGRCFSDWPRDVATLADILGIGQFAIIGVSGGGPYALACAAQFNSRLTAVTTVCGLGPLSPGNGAGLPRGRRVACRLLRLTPWLIPFVSSRMGRRLGQDPESVFSYLLTSVPEPDYEILTIRAHRRLLQESFTEAVRNGASGIASDALIYLSEWGFDPSRIRVPVTFWHGELDRTVPASMSQKLAEILPNARLLLLPNEGHYSLPFRYHREILDALPS